MSFALDRIAEYVAKTVAMMRAGLEPEEIHAKLMAQGATAPLAGEIVGFVPEAYCYVMMRDSGVRFSDSFQRRLASGAISEYEPLSSQPVWQAAIKFAQAEFTRKASSEDFAMMALCSAGCQSINFQLNNGTKFEQIQLCPLLLPYWP